MVAKFLQTAGVEAAKGTGTTTINRLLGPGLIFWGGTLLLFDWTWNWFYLSQILLWKPIEQAALAFTLAMLVILSDLWMSWFTLPLLRLFEGYWPTRLGHWLRNERIGRLKKKILQQEEQLDTLQKQGWDKLSLAEQTKLLTLDNELTNNYPVELHSLMPTRLGNILRAAETYPRERYGLDAIIMWPRLWLILPTEVRTELSTARQNLNRAAQFLGWGIFFLGLVSVWGYRMGVTAWFVTLAIAFAFVVVTYQHVCSSAETYGDLLRAAFDLHRFDLYKQMNWPLPKDSETEEKVGEQLTQYIFRGCTKLDIKFEYQKD